MKLHATIKGHPAPKVIWAKMNSNLKDRQGILIKSSKTDTAVTVENVNRYDAGKYVLNLESVAGMKMYTVAVKVLGNKPFLLLDLNSCGFKQTKIGTLIVSLHL